MTTFASGIEYGYASCVTTGVVSKFWWRGGEGTSHSRPRVARNRPVKPPIVNKPTKPMAYSIGVSYETEPLYGVAVQLKILMAEGMATSMLRKENTITGYGD